MNTQEFYRKVDNGEAKVLTVEVAKTLKGKKIYWWYKGYSGNENHVDEIAIGDIVSELDYYSTQPCEGYSSRTEYWRSYMTKSQINEKKNTLLLLDTDGKNKFIRAHLNFDYFKEPTFTCSDADREVYYLEV